MQYLRGVRMCDCMVKSLPMIEDRFRKAGIIKTDLSGLIFQGAYSGSVSASANTHKGGGAIDVRPALATSAATRIWRQCGVAAWPRPTMSPFHLHGIWINCPHADPSAKAQVRQYRNGTNGLASYGRDTYPRPGYITWQSALAKWKAEQAKPKPKPTPAPKPKGLLNMAKTAWPKKDLTLKENKWTHVPVNSKGDVSLLTGKHDLVLTTVRIEAYDLPEGAQVYARLYVEDWPMGGARKGRRWTHKAIVQIVADKKVRWRAGNGTEHNKLYAQDRLRCELKVVGADNVKVHVEIDNTY